MLHTSFPLSLIIFILPIHLPITMAIIICEITYIMIPTRPSKHTITMFLIILELSLITNMTFLQIIPFHLYSIPMTNTIPKCSYIEYFITSIFFSITPNVCTLSLHIPIAVLPIIHIPIGEVFHTMTVFQ